MFHEPPKNFLYLAYKIYIEHSDGDKIKNGTATGFVLDIGNGIPYIVTNRHIVDIDYKQPTAKYKNFTISKFIITGRNPDDTEYSIELQWNSKIYFHDDIENDIVLIMPVVSSAEDAILHWHFSIEHLADEEIFSKMEPLDLICYTGFPSTHDKFSNRPILRSGHIASDPRYNYSWNSDYQGQCVAYEGFSSAGASGSPIFAPSRGMRYIPNSRNGYLIGVNAGHIPSQDYGHSGVSYFYKSTVIHEIVESNNMRSIKS
nr:hypothetical protein [Tanacetum cinerariifolium]